MASCLMMAGLFTTRTTMMVAWPAPAFEPATFRDLDLLHGGIVPPDAERAFVERIVPPGSTVVEARAILIHAGARAIRSPNTGKWLFAYCAIVMVEHEPEERLVLIRIEERGDVVASVRVERE